MKYVIKFNLMHPQKNQRLVFLAIDGNEYSCICIRYDEIEKTFTQFYTVGFKPVKEFSKKDMPAQTLLRVFKQIKDKMKAYVVTPDPEILSDINIALRSY
jgi:hypothetical protein